MCLAQGPQRSGAGEARTNDPSVSSQAQKGSKYQTISWSVWNCTLRLTSFLLGVTVCTMAVGRKINMEEIRKISSPGCYFQLKSYSAYERVMKYALNIRLRQSRRRS